MKGDKTMINVNEMKKQLAKKMNENRCLSVWNQALERNYNSSYDNIYTSNGNTKLNSNENVSFIIFNIPAIMTCPYRTNLCETNCYAVKAEIQYGLNCMLRRFANFKLSQRKDFVELMIKHLEGKVNHHTRRNKLIVVRIHESGDFYSKEYAMKWLEIARHFINNKKIVFMAYTKSLPYFENENIPNNFVIRASIWADTEKHLLEMSSKYPTYTALTPEEMEKSKASYCDCLDCGKCGMCWNRLVNMIACLIH